MKSRDELETILNNISCAARIKFEEIELTSYYLEGLPGVRSSGLFTKKNHIRFRVYTHREKGNITHNLEIANFVENYCIERKIDHHRLEHNSTFTTEKNLERNMFIIF